MSQSTAANPAALQTAAACFVCIPVETREWVELYLLAKGGGGTMDPGQINQAAAMFQKIPPEMRDPVALYLQALAAP